MCFAQFSITMIFPDNSLYNSLPFPGFPDKWSS